LGTKQQLLTMLNYKLGYLWNINIL